MSKHSNQVKRLSYQHLGMMVELKRSQKHCRNDHVLTKHASQREAQDDNLLACQKQEYGI